MASSFDYLNYVLDLLREVSGISFKKMMGEYILYKNNIIFGGIYDNRFLIKKSESTKELGLNEAIPYPGGSAMFLLDIENADEIKDIVNNLVRDFKTMKYNELLELLKSKSDGKFAEFSKTLSNSGYIVIGVKNPDLRAIIKEHTKDKELKLEDFETGKYLEIDFIYFGLGINRANGNKEKLEFLKNNIRKAKSWAITDTASTYLKKITFAEFWDFFISLYKGRNTYERRMAYVLGLKLYKEKEILQVLNYIILKEEYMVMMAEAWLLATLSINFPNDIYNFLSKINDDTLKRKTISKIVESFRIDEGIKSKFKDLRNL